MQDLTVVQHNLPATVDDLAKFVLVGREKLVAVRAEIRAIDKVGLAQEVRAQKLQEAQAISEAVLDAEVKIGELMAKVPKATPNNNPFHQIDTAGDFVKPKADVIREAGFTQKQAERFQILAAHPEIVEQAKAEARENDDIVSRSLVLNMVKAKEKQEKREEKAERKLYSLADELPKDTCKLFNADIRNGLPEIADNSVDFIITDPPYPKEYLPLFGDLSDIASRVLKPGGSLIVMSGELYLPEVIALLSRSMDYYWTLAYLTQGAGSTNLWTRRVNTQWKPLLWYTKGEYKGDFVGDIVTSPANDYDKSYHEWGQTIGGMIDIIERFTYPDQIILDPFLGGGTTGVAAVTMGRRFIGTDIEQGNIEKSKKRIMEEYANARG